MLSVYAQDTKVSEVRKVDAFSSIEITSGEQFILPQSDTYSFKIEGMRRRREEYRNHSEGRLSV